jgi:hypothetical protein
MGLDRSPYCGTLYEAPPPPRPRAVGLSGRGALQVLGVLDPSASGSVEFRAFARWCVVGRGHLSLLNN